MEKVDPNLIHRVRAIEIAAQARVLDRFSGMYRSVFRGRGMEIEEVREFQYGDDPRAINWAKTAEMGRPFVNSYREERDLTVMLLLDVSESMDFASHFENKKDRQANVAALIAFSAIHNHDRVGLLLFSSQVESYIPPKRGVRHGARLIRDFLTFVPKGGKTDVGMALDYLRKVLRTRCIVFLISDFFSVPYEKSFERASGRNDLVAVRIIDEEEKSLPELGSVRFRDVETGSLLVVNVNEMVGRRFAEERKQQQAALKRLSDRCGAGFIEIDTECSFIEKLATYFQARKKRLAV